MEKIGLRIVSGALVVTLLALTVASWKMIGTASGDKSEGLEKKPHIRHTKEEREAARKASRASVNTGELRKEALEILGRIEEGSDIMDILPDAARLSALFREWGEVDFEGAKRFLETEELAKKRQRPDRSFADDLLLAALIGYSKSDPVRAWDAFLPTQDYSERPLLLGGITPYPHEVVTEEVMRSLCQYSEELALKALREMDSQYNFLLANCLSVILSESDDAQFRNRVLEEFLVHRSFGPERLGVIYAGLAKHDPRIAWDLLKKWSELQKFDTKEDAEFRIGDSFVTFLTQRHPEAALEFIATVESDKMKLSYFESWIFTQAVFHPDLIVKALEMDAFKPFQAKFLPEVFVTLIDNQFAWPLTEKNVPLTAEQRFESVKQAVESSKLPEDLKERFLVAIEKKISVDKGK